MMRENLNFLTHPSGLAVLNNGVLKAILVGLTQVKFSQHLLFLGLAGLDQKARKLETNFNGNVAGQLFILVRTGRIDKIIGFKEAVETEEINRILL